MTLKYRYLGTLALLAASCGTDNQTAGGQSGTDANGGIYCNQHLLEPSGDVTPLAQPLNGGLSPNDYYDNIEGSYEFSCANGIHVSVNIQRGMEARTTLGLSGSPEVPRDYCPALQLDATVHVEASDGSITHEASFLTSPLTGRAYTRFVVGGPSVDESGKDIDLWLETDYAGPNAGRITSLRTPDNTLPGCQLATEQGEGGHGNEPDPAWAGNAGAQ